MARKKLNDNDKNGLYVFETIYPDSKTFKKLYELIGIVFVVVSVIIALLYQSAITFSLDAFWLQLNLEFIHFIYFVIICVLSFGMSIIYLFNLVDFHKNKKVYLKRIR